MRKRISYTLWTGFLLTHSTGPASAPMKSSLTAQATCFLVARFTTLMEPGSGDLRNPCPLNQFAIVAGGIRRDSAQVIRQVGIDCPPGQMFGRLFLRCGNTQQTDCGQRKGDVHGQAHISRNRRTVSIAEYSPSIAECSQRMESGIAFLPKEKVSSKGLTGPMNGTIFGIRLAFQW